MLFCHVFWVCLVQRNIITDGLGAGIYDSDQECGGCPSVVLISEVVSMAVVKIGDSVLVRLAYETVSMVLAKKSAIPTFIWVSVVFLRGTNEDWDCCCRQAGDAVALAVFTSGA